MYVQMDVRAARPSEVLGYTILSITGKVKVNNVIFLRMINTNSPSTTSVIFFFKKQTNKQPQCFSVSLKIYAHNKINNHEANKAIAGALPLVLSVY